MIKMTATTLAGATVLGLPLDAQASDSRPAEGQNTGKKVMVIGAHPDDPETGCGVYLTHGEAGIEGKSHDEAASIRTREAQNACAVTGARPIFLTQIDGDTRIDAQRYAQVRQVIAQEKPSLVLTHWPVDSHRDHCVCSVLVRDAWRRLGYSFALYYFEVMTGMQTQNFTPTDFVDITAVAATKRQACNCHVSQNMDDLYTWHDKMELFRGMQAGVTRAEAYVRQWTPRPATQL